MRNEWLLIGSVVLIYGTVLMCYRFFGKGGLFVLNGLVTVLANIEVLMLVDGFGLTQTLGNVLFASTFLITDILSENEGQQEATKAVTLGIFASAFMLLVTQYWLLYVPSPADEVADHIHILFSQTPRLLLGSFLGYAVSQKADVWLYHRLWRATEQKTGDKKRFLWLRNNAATLLSQVLNTVIFNVVAFAGRYDTATLLSVIVSGYVIFLFTSLLDTPAVYFARRMKEKSKVPV